MGVLGRFGRRRPPTDAEAAETMRDLAEAFVAGVAEDGEELTWTARDVGRLDDFCDRFAHSSPDEGRRESFALAMGAYLGELMVRHAGGRWTYDTDERTATVSLPNGFVAYPLSKVAKRITHGPTHDIGHFWHYAVTGELPPGARVRTL